jgi:hypothetical protein
MTGHPNSCQQMMLVQNFSSSESAVSKENVHNICDHQFIPEGE